MKLPQTFFLNSNVVAIARKMLGKILFTKIDNQITGGIIVETEAYSYKEKGCHAYKGMTKRNEVMFREGGIAYVYLCYGVHEMFNVVTNKKGKADAVLVRALEPLVGIEQMMKRVNAKTERKIASGPGKLTKALGIDRRCNGKEMNSVEIWIEDKNLKFKNRDIGCSPRIGIDYAGDDAWLPWRFTISNINDYKFKIQNL